MWPVKHICFFNLGRLDLMMFTYNVALTHRIRFDTGIKNSLLKQPKIS